MTNESEILVPPSDRQFQTLLDGLPVGVGITDMQGNLAYYNDAMMAPGGWQRGDIEKLKNVELLYFDPQERQRVLAQAIQKGSIDNVEVKFRKKIGGSYPARMNLRKIFFQKQEAWLAVVQDITEVSKSERERDSLVIQLENGKKAMLNLLEDLDEERQFSEQEKQRYLATLENVGEGVIATDKNGNIILVNRAAEVMLGYTQLALLNKKFVRVIRAENERGESIPIIKRAMTQSMKTRKTVTGQYMYIKKDGTRFVVDTVAAPILQEKEMLGVVTVFRDVTKEKEIDKAKTEFVSLASHQLRTPLGIAKWYLEAIQDNEGYSTMSKILKEYLVEVYSSNERVLALVRDLLSVSRIDQGRVKNTPQLIDICKLMKSVLEEMKIVALKRNISLRLIVKPALCPKVRIDPLRLREVIENLIANALQYNKPSGSVVVTVDKKPDNKLVITVKDTGVGIPVNDLKKLFQKFFRSEKNSIHNTEGSGLGLYVVRSYVENWGGTVSVVSKEGKGSTFMITLPIKVKK